MLNLKVARNFDVAAPEYDTHAAVQVSIAKYLASWATPPLPPRTILDIGCGTGFASAAAAQKWPMATISALDPAPAMLIEALRKLPKLNVILGDAATLKVAHRYDVIFSSMMLHWLSNPSDAVRRWRDALNPEGRLYVALLTEGSFEEWRELCAKHGMRDGLWKMPPRDFGETVAYRCEQKKFTASFASAQDFLHHLKAIGAATPDPAHKPLGAGDMRRLLREAARPFEVTYRALFLEIIPAPVA